MNRIEEIRECFEVETGTPTLTVELPEQQRMIPYNNFETAQFKSGGQIVMLFAEWILEIRGEHLAGLWEQYQMQDERIIRVSDNPEDDDCRISHLKLISREAS